MVCIVCMACMECMVGMVYMVCIVCNVCSRLVGWYPIVRNFLLLIQYHAICGGEPLLSDFFHFFFKLSIFSKCFALLLYYFYFILSICILFLFIIF